MSKHTPGPWVVDDLGDEFFDETNHKYGIGSKNSPVYRVAKIEGLGDTSLADARLIAAAPDLLEALEQIAELDGDAEQQKFRLTRFQASQIARAAIHKVTRGQG